MHPANVNKGFFIEAEASDSFVGAVINLTDDIVAYFSKMLNDVQKKYSTYEKECLAICGQLSVGIGGLVEKNNPHL